MFIATTELEVDHANLELFQTVISQTDTYRRQVPIMLNYIVLFV